ncbi:MAG: T9SS type A sorting domain-containing protein [Flavobacteriaceae bacterium]|nr:T9SS type A sorting domain-containing protein [Muriicola sp.]NNC62075.1 T9SS type A sorting domain-containing protein [Eudoraea sp.]NNK20789.1 T9SS type A sorting domain-containing protein [Flavobacteriaceae bacterium]MBT8291509.1 T9SS type A sorting domain-containing protein [Muriicola sp.]NNK36713.1 T9SS type A sorting domain-containing protein [Eudoraea sp.]
MKILYLTAFLLVSLWSYGQEKPTAETGPSQEIPNFKLYPNPAYSDVVYITSDYNDTKIITVYDVLGEVVLRDRISTNSLNISRLVPGVYVLQVKERHKSMTRKLVVK